MVNLYKRSLDTTYVMKKTFIKGWLTVSGFLPAIALAQVDPVDSSNRNSAPDVPANRVTSYGELIDLIILIARWMFGILMAVGLLYLIYAAFRYLLAQGDDDKITEARKALTWSIIAIVIGFLAWGLIGLVESFWGEAFTS